MADTTKQFPGQSRVELLMTTTESNTGLIELCDDDPQQVGWYATLMCWDVEEGVFPGGCYWNGKEWDTNASIRYWPIVFNSRQEASGYAYENDPDLR